MQGLDAVMYRLTHVTQTIPYECYEVAGRGVDAIFIAVGVAPTDFMEDYRDRKPFIYTGKKRPLPNDLAFIKNQRIHMVDWIGDDELFSKWVLEALQQKPKLLIATDSEKELHTWLA
jgi:hypothetical protein